MAEYSISEVGDVLLGPPFQLLLQSAEGIPTIRTELKGDEFRYLIHKYF